MVHAKWTFWVHLVQDGCRSGLILGKKAEPAGRGEHSYFYLANGDGLRPNKQILRLCGDAIYPLDPRTDESTVFDLLRSCAIGLDAKAFKPDRIPIEEVFGPPEYYSKEVFRLFQPRDKSGCLRNPNSDLRRFLISQDVFEVSVLSKGRTDTFLRSQTRDFAVLAPHEVLPPDRLDYLEDARHLLALDVDPPPKHLWFRKQGPVASDFEAGFVYIPTKKLNALRRLVDDNFVSVLQGPPATGKTVLVRTLAYERIRDGLGHTYYFDERPFDVDRLAQAINSVTGLVILEDIHRNSIAYQRLLPMLNPDDRRHVLLTTCLPLRDSQHSKYTDLAALPSLSSGVREQTYAYGELIQFYASKESPATSFVDFAVNIGSVASDNLWLLAHAIMGGRACRWAGDPNTWIAEGVRNALADLLLYREDQHAMEYPEIVVALSPLYSSEVSTAESYLVERLGFHPGALEGLVRRGEITKYMDDGEAFYGLSHSALARAYWAHGHLFRKRRRLPELAEFICDYARTGARNAFQAIAKADSTVYERLNQEGLIHDLLGKERSLDLIAGWLRSLGDQAISWRMALVLVDKISASDEFGAAGSCIAELESRICTAVDFGSIARRIVQPNHIGALPQFLYDLIHACNGADERFVSCLEAIMPHLAEALIADTHDSVLIRTIEALSRGGFDEIAKKLLALMDRTQVVHAIVFTGYAQLGWWLNRIAALLGCAVGELYGRIDMASLASVANTQGYEYAPWCVRSLWTVNPELGAELCLALNTEKMGQYFSKHPLRFVDASLEPIKTVIPQVWAKLEREIKWERVAAEVSQGPRGRAWELIDWLRVLDRPCCKRLCRLLNLEEMARNLIGPDDLVPELDAYCWRKELVLVDREIGRRFGKLLKRESGMT